MDNTESASDSFKVPEEDGAVVNNIRRHSNSSYTDSLDTDSQSLGQCSDQVETSESKPKRHASRLPVKTKSAKSDVPTSDKSEAPTSDKSDVPASDNDVASSGPDAGEKGKACKGSKHGKMECMECNNVGQHAPTRETITSRMRIEKSHLSHGTSMEKEEYLTPTQRKGQTIKDLKKQVKDLEKDIEDSNQEIDGLKKSIGQEAEQILDTKNQEIREIKESLETMRTKHEDLTMSYEESVKAVNALEDTLRELRDKNVEQEVYHKKMYLEMYEKGKASAIFEREDELEMLARSAKSKVTMRELQRKLSESQAELAKWQSLRRNEMYEVAERPETEAETTLKFLKDSFFHFLTHDKDSDDHLRAMIQIFNFSEVQKKRITKALHDRKKRDKS